MTHPIKCNNLFATPHDMYSLMSWVAAHTGSERVVAATAAGMTWNLAAKLLKDQEAIADEFNERVAEITQQDHIDAWDYWNQGEL